MLVEVLALWLYRYVRGASLSALQAKMFTHTVFEAKLRSY